MYSMAISTRESCRFIILMSADSRIRLAIVIYTCGGGVAARRRERVGEAAKRLTRIICIPHIAPPPVRHRLPHVLERFGKSCVFPQSRVHATLLIPILDIGYIDVRLCSVALAVLSVAKKLPIVKYEILRTDDLSRPVHVTSPPLPLVFGYGTRKGCRLGKMYFWIFLTYCENGCGGGSNPRPSEICK